MNPSALLLMVFVQVSVTLITVYFFWRVLKTPKKTEEDSYTENEEPKDN
jgi:heme/copper-type cytochrome/quinol oxidase subunit 2